MEQVTYFTPFLTDEVNLPQYKLDYLDERVERIYRSLRRAALGTRVLGMKKQGSWAQRTIINPRDGEEFDADFMVELEEQDGWHPTDYQRPVFDALDNYCAMHSISTAPEAKNRCVRVTYANDMHVDVVPYVNRTGVGECIVNTDTDEWEDTDPDGFTSWMQRRDEISNGNMRRILRILKYLRDHRGYFEGTKSIILTTIVGNVISVDKTRAYAGCYGNVSKALRRVTRDLADWVRDQYIRPEVDDPSRADATFTHRWLQTEYDVFRRDIRDVADLVEAAINCDTSWSDSTAKWRELLGDEFGPHEMSSQTSKFPATGGAAGGAPPVETTTGRSGRAG